MYSLFKDRTEAGRMLAERLRDKAGRDWVVLALPRGGVPVAYEVAMALGAELDVLPVRKLGVPTQPELAMGAIAPGGAQFVDHETMRSARVSEAQFNAVLAEEQAELARREAKYRGNRPPVDVRGKQVIVIDDGMATGATLHAALQALRQREPARITIALPVAPVGSERQFDDVAEEFVCIAQPTLFFSVGQHYDLFEQTTDDEVRHLLASASDR
jgi:putative phosphoribosyl transferase